MKNIIALGLLTLSTLSFAERIEIEFDKTQEIACFNQAKKMGCVAKDGEVDANCVEKNKNKLTKECKAMHNAQQLNKE